MLLCTVMWLMFRHVFVISPNEIITEVILNLDSSVNFDWVRHEAGW